jgi:hypothetical protein
VTFTETGPGTFSSGGQVVAVTDASGVARRRAQASAGTESGTQQVTATITTAGTQCSQGAGQGGSNQTPNPTAGSCSDTEEHRIVGPSAPPSAPPSPTASPTPTGPAACSTPATLTTPTEITYGSAALVTVRATPGGPSCCTPTRVRRRSTAPCGRASSPVTARSPGRCCRPANTRLYAQENGCAAGPSAVTAVRSIASINARRLGTRLYSFYGSVQPRRPGQVVSLYRRTAAGDVLTSQARTDSNGVWSITRQFTGSGEFGFYARTGNDLVNLGGTSPVRATVVH